MFLPVQSINSYQIKIYLPEPLHIYSTKHKFSIFWDTLLVFDPRSIDYENDENKLRNYNLVGSNYIPNRKFQQI